MTSAVVYAHERSASGPATPSPRLQRFERAVNAVCAAIAAFSLVAITLLTVAEVISRNVAATPLGWNVALVEQYLMTAMAFFGAVAAYHGGAHIAVATIYDRFPEPVRRPLTVLAHLIVLVCFVMLAWAGTEAAAFSFRMDEAPVPGMAELPLPTWWWKSIMPVAAYLGALLAACNLWHTLRGDHVPDHGDTVATEMAEVR